MGLDLSRDTTPYSSSHKGPLSNSRVLNLIILHSSSAYNAITKGREQYRPCPNGLNVSTPRKSGRTYKSYLQVPAGHPSPLQSSFIRDLQPQILYSTGLVPLSRFSTGTKPYFCLQHGHYLLRRRKGSPLWTSSFPLPLHITLLCLSLTHPTSRVLTRLVLVLRLSIWSSVTGCPVVDS